ncbi:MAG TPA: hypothetical protein DIS76_06945 [Rhodospirillaceae bacterium]|nr:hypothetical protein [Rhodospirillaceae bacterium]
MLHSFKSGAARGLFPIILIAVCLCAFSCEADTGNPKSAEEDYSEHLSDEALEILDNSEPGQPTPLNEIILDNGQSVESILDKYGSGPNSMTENNKK